ncbi:1,4-alpha-glucan branching enzyme, partial [Streptomyces bacillaris]
HDPHSVLGQHQVAAPGVEDPITVIRALRPLAEAVFAILPTGAHIELAHLGHGIWQGIDIVGPGAYELEARYDGGSTWTTDDPYRFLPTIGELDLHLIREGRHEQLWTALGAHVRDLGGVVGTSFTVWAPHARAVRVVGDFNGWDGTLSAMRNMGASGVWELFVPGLGEGSIYK